MIYIAIAIIIHGILLFIAISDIPVFLKYIGEVLEGIKFED